MPTPARIDSAAILAAVATRRRALGSAQWLALALGFLFTVIGPLMMTALAWFTALLFGYYLSWWLLFAIVSAVFVPILFWYAARGSENMLLDAAKSGVSDTSASMWRLSRIGGPMGQVASLAAFAASPRGSAAGFQEIFLTGPRQIVKSLRRMRVARKLKAARLDRAAQLLAALLQRDRGVEITALLLPPEKPGDIRCELALLMFHDWIGISDDATRAWALSDARRSLGLS